MATTAPTAAQNGHHTRSAEDRPLALQPISYTHYHVADAFDLAAVLTSRGWQRVRSRRRAKTLQLWRGISTIMITPAGCVTAKGPGAVAALAIIHQEMQQGVR